MKKKILVVFTGEMEIGGVERSLLGLLDSFDYGRYDVDLFLYGHHGPLFPLINKNVNILPEISELAYLRESMLKKLKHKNFYAAYRRLIDKIKEIFVNADADKTTREIVLKSVPAINTHYDLAISFFRPFDVLKERVSADAKVAWIHTDYSNSVTVDNKEKIFNDYSGPDYIAAVSEQCANSFAKAFPSLADKLLVVENILSEKFIGQQASAFDATPEMPDDGFVKLLSVGRFVYAKNFENIPAICKLIRETGCNVKWYIIGFGGFESKIRESIKKEGMEDYVIILGKKDNPYPYLKACDIYVQPSRFEGKCVSVCEAQLLGKPVVITAYETSKSQLNAGYDGIIVPMDNEDCAKGIADLIKNQEQQKKLSENTKNCDYTNSEQVKKLYELMK